MTLKRVQIPRPSDAQHQLAKELKGARFVLWKNPDRLTERQKLKLARLQEINQHLYRGYLLCQQLRIIYRVPCEHALVLLDAWLSWARRSRASTAGISNNRLLPSGSSQDNDR